MSLAVYSQGSYEHLSQEVVKYRFDADEELKKIIFQRFLDQGNTCIFFDFSNHQNLEYLFETELVTLFTHLNEYLEEHPDAIKTILFQSVSEVWINRIFNQTNLYNKKYTHQSSNIWPSLKELSNSQKQLVSLFIDGSDSQIIASGQYNHASGSFLHSKEIVSPGQLLMLTVDLPTETTDFRLAPGFIDAFIDTWKRTGQVPNFILLDGVEFRQKINQIINSTKKSYGTISFETASHHKINWTGDFMAITGNSFCFPVYAGEHLSIAPQSPGFSFYPEKLDIGGEDDQKVSIKSKKKKISDGVTAYFPLDDNLDDLFSKSLKGKSDSITFTEDFNRSKVAALRGKHFGKLTELKALGLVNESFTISVWAKLISIDDEDQIILSSIENKYSEGLHILIRDKKPYFAFFHNDLAGKTNLEENKWYNIVWRYRKQLQEQAIFINGELDTLASGRPPLRGSGNLILGYRKTSSGSKTFFNGYIDDIVFWNRALGENEIQHVYEGSLDLENNLSYSNLLWIGLVIPFTLFLVFLFKKRAKSNRTTDDSVNESEIKETDLNRNAILMFGGFKVFDRNGINITNEITPRLKELFILLYISSLKTKKGISSEDLSSSIWHDLSRQSAINNRGVSTTKLRHILSKLDGIELKYKNQFWFITVSDAVYSDYADFLDLVKEPFDIKNLSGLTHILRTGEFLPNLSKEWLDPYKFNVSNRIIDIYTPLLKELWSTKDYDLLIDYCDIILTFDMVHEIAIRYKVAALRDQKKHQQALRVYQHFVGQYRQFYQEEFVVSFNDFHP
ncbi:hypothetical protein QQ008_25920 [Fulvivirgaceae bacterium BMA10]|uniref:LamG-like jellyroll fold domain-containing protein n=1 Tax=Splendidivirga corallicola TaxID=3051826 RepID=A0ABT8KZM6_9BACT|nr:hypothetical protein [Fulvivirgaceae bacterium BMA10]